ncbi:hypothetical protein [Streptomyces sp. 7N604]|uniref:hypothetical protein n=1 Tax=Streptomyces sp. 7N604 TaxID=3457415 RepID=UPI003FD3A8BE
MLRAAWKGCPDEDLPPVRALRRPGWLGRVRISGEHTDPCDVQAGCVQVEDWHTAYTALGGKEPAKNEYFGLPEDLFDPDDETAEDRTVAAIDHLPVAFLTGLYEGEQGLSLTKRDYWTGEDHWSLIEAYVRLGLLPPVHVLFLPRTPDLPRSEQLTTYLIAAYLRAACHQVAGQLRYDMRSAWRAIAQMRPEA